MITINNLEEMKKFYNKPLNTYIFHDNVEFIIDIKVESSIDAYDIKAQNINALDIDAFNINANDIKAKNIDAFDIEAYDIEANDINACDIEAQNIDAWNINANNIEAQDIKYYAYCIAYYSFKCKSASSDRVNSICKCLDGKIEYIK